MEEGVRGVSAAQASLLVSLVSAPITKYASCSRAHALQKGMPWISTTAWWMQGCSVLLRTWHGPNCFVVASVKRSSFPMSPTVVRS